MLTVTTLMGVWHWGLKLRHTLLSTDATSTRGYFFSFFFFPQSTRCGELGRSRAGTSLSRAGVYQEFSLSPVMCRVPLRTAVVLVHSSNVYVKINDVYININSKFVNAG